MGYGGAVHRRFVTGGLAEVRRILILRTPVNKPEIKAGLWRWTSLGLLVPGKYGGIENDPDRQS